MSKKTTFYGIPRKNIAFLLEAERVFHSPGTTKAYFYCLTDANPEVRAEAMAKLYHDYNVGVYPEATEGDNYTVVIRPDSPVQPANDGYKSIW